MNFSCLPCLNSEVFESRYFLVEEAPELKRGRNGALFRGYEVRREVDVFVKILDPLCDEATIGDCEETPRVPLLALRHPNLVELHDAFRLLPPPDADPTNSLPVLVMNYVPGAPLSTFYLPLTTEQAAHVFDQTKHALDYLHAQGWVHRDVKPHNLLIDESGDDWHVTLCDLELAGQVGFLPDFIVGTPEYMAPLAAARQPIHPDYDGWSLGCTLYELATGRLPFGKREESLSELDGIETIQARIRTIDPTELLADVPEALRPRLASCFAGSASLFSSAAP